MENKSVDITSETDEATKYCVECGAKMSKSLRSCSACGESQI
ncbi:MAG: hypothetical protein WB501_04910 [Nitrososphaeraceae archaeon]